MNDRPLLAFLHVFKTGGTTASDWIDQVAAGCTCFIPRNPGHFQEASTEQDLDAFEIVRGHFEMRFAARVFRRPRIVFTLVRDPEACMLSALSHLAADKQGMLNPQRNHPRFERVDLDFLNSTLLLWRKRSGMQCWYFMMDRALNRHLYRASWRESILSSVMEGFARVDIVGITERLDDSLRLLAWRMRWPAPRNIGRARQSDAGRHRLPPIRQIGSTPPIGV